MAAALCPNCESATFVEKSRAKIFSRSGKQISVPILFSVCSACGFEAVNRAQSRQNKQSLRAREKQYDGFLTGEAILEIRRLYGLTQADASKLFGGGPIAFSKYENEEVVPSEAMNNLLMLAREFPSVVEFLAAKSGMNLNRRGVFPMHDRRKVVTVQYRRAPEVFDLMARDVESYGRLQAAAFGHLCDWGVFETSRPTISEGGRFVFVSPRAYKRQDNNSPNQKAEAA